MMKAKYVLFLMTVLLLISPAVEPNEFNKNLEKGLESIQPVEAYGYCKKFASVECAGRLTGHQGYTRAAKWAARKFERWGLKPISWKEGYLQAYPSPYTVVDEAEMTLLLPTTADEEEGMTEELESDAPEPVSFEEIALEPLTDFMPQLFTDSGEQEAALVFAGWGIEAPEIGYDDYAGIDVDGKFVLCFRGTPDREDRRYEEHDHHRHRMQKAKERGALGIVYIYEEPRANPNGEWIERFTPAMISEAVADRIFTERGITAADLKGDLKKYKQPISFPVGARLRYRVISRHFHDGKGYNVIGYIKGSDAELRKECIVLGAHLDHCGEHLGMRFPGAEDNASGSATVMEIAEAFTRLGKKPKRSVVFVLFGGEEMGLMGSYYFAEHQLSQFEKIDAMFNFDMTGSGEGAVCGYSVDVPELEEVLREADGQVGTLRRTYEIKRVGVRSSDYAPFYLLGAACIAFWSNGPHLHYHKPGDTIYRVNPDMMADIARLGFIAAFMWADRDAPNE